MVQRCLLFELVRIFGSAYLAYYIIIIDELVDMLYNQKRTYVRYDMEDTLLKGVN